MSMSICLSVCLSVRSHISKTARPNLATLSVHKNSEVRPCDSGICERQTDRQTDKQTYSSQYVALLPGTKKLSVFQSVVAVPSETL